MKYIANTTCLFFVICVLSLVSKAQVETTILNTPTHPKANTAPFFTNRPIVVNDDNSYSFKNNSTIQTNTLYFCNYNFDTDSVEVIYRAINLSDTYPTEKVKHNLFYQMYQRQRIERGVKDFHIIVGGYGKSYNKQIKSYMQRLKTNYGDALFDRAVIMVFAWGTQDKAYRYYNAIRSAKRGARDFALFQHMLDDFVSDEEFFKTHPNDFSINILFSSMGNELFRNYLLNRSEQNIPLVKTYNRVTFVGSVSPRNSFEEGNAFCNLDEMTDTVDVFVNSKDILLKMSSVAHFKNRMGNKGPKDPEELPPFVKVINIKNLINFKDMSGLGHDYILTNPIVQDQILQHINENVSSKEK